MDCTRVSLTLTHTHTHSLSHRRAHTRTYRGKKSKNKIFSIYLSRKSLNESKILIVAVRATPFIDDDYLTTSARVDSPSLSPSLPLPLSLTFSPLSFLPSCDSFTLEFISFESE